jgi:hypothetical protein
MLARTWVKIYIINAGPNPSVCQGGRDREDAYLRKWQRLCTNYQLTGKNQVRVLNSVVDFHQDFVASTHYNAFPGKRDRVLFYWPNHSGGTQLSKQEEDSIGPRAIV